MTQAKWTRPAWHGPTATPRPARDTGTIARRRRVLDALARLGRAA